MYSFASVSTASSWYVSLKKGLPGNKHRENRSHKYGSESKDINGLLDD